MTLQFSSFSRSYTVMCDWITAELDWLSGLRECVPLQPYVIYFTGFPLP